MGQEGVNSSDIPLLHGQRYTVLLRNSEPIRQCRDNMVGHSAGPEHLPYQPSRQRGFMVDHDSRGAGVCCPAASPDPTRPVPRWVPISRASTKEARNESEICEWHRKAQLPCFYLSPYFGDSGNPNSTLFRIFEGLTVFRQKVPKVKAMLGLIPCYGLV